MPKRAAPGKANTFAHAQCAKIDWPYIKYEVEGIKRFEFLSSKRRLNEYESYLLVTHFPSQRRQYNSQQKAIKAAETQKPKSNEVVKKGKMNRAAGRANTQSGEGNPSNDDDGVSVYERVGAKVHLVF